MGQSIELQLRRLEYIQDAIARKEYEIESTQQEIDHLSHDKTGYEQQYQITRKKIEALTSREQEINRNLTASQREKEQFTARIDETSDLWKKQFQIFYLTHLTNNQTAEQISDNHYFPIMITQTKERIDEDVDLLNHIVSNIEENQKNQQGVRRERSKENQVIEGYRKQISKLNEDIEKLTKEEQEILNDFAVLQQSRENLENLITLFQNDAGSTQFSYRFTTNKLPWPITGEVISTFGKKQDEHYKITLLSNGIDILTDSQQEVKAVDFGVVVFAEHFRSYGRLVIIDHQNGYYSLYGNNGTLLVTKDDVVSLGQVIALSGRQNGLDSYLLHFELRRHSTPVDPLTYLE
jgi:septal ring factor EnvC (AmiA/AmiB activator)